MTLSAGAGSPHREEDFVPPESSGDSVQDLVQRSFFLLEQVTGEAIMYFCGQLFAMDAEIRAMCPPAMDVQRMRFFRALARIAAGQDDPAGLVPYLEELRYSPKNAAIRCQASSAAEGS